MKDYKPGESIVVSIRRHLWRKNRGEEAKEIPPQEIAGKFIRYHEGKPRAWVEIQAPADDAPRLRSFLLGQIRRAE